MEKIDTDTFLTILFGGSAFSTTAVSLYEKILDTELVNSLALWVGVICTVLLFIIKTILYLIKMKSAALDLQSKKRQDAREKEEDEHAVNLMDQAKKALKDEQKRDEDGKK